MKPVVRKLKFGLMGGIAIVAAFLTWEGGFAADSINLDVLEVQVRRLDQDNFVSGATLVFTVVPKGNDSYSKAVVSGRDGVGRLDVGGQAIREIHCRVECPGFLAVETRWSIADLFYTSRKNYPLLRTTVRLVPRRQELSGIVVDAQNKGIPGVTVLLDYFHSGTYDLEKGKLAFAGFTETIRSQTDDQGRWKTKGWISRGDRSLRMRFQHPQYPDHGDPSEPADPKRRGMPWWTWEPGLPWHSGLADLLATGEGVTVMTQGWTRSGRVLDVSGEAVREADVAVSVPVVGRDGSIVKSWLHPQLKVQTDDAGRFEIKNQVFRFPLLHREAVDGVLADYEVSINVAKNGLKVEHEAVPYFRADGKESDFQLQAGPIFEGRIVDGRDMPIPNVSVSIEGKDQATGREFVSGLYSGADGRFVWPYSLVGEFTIHFSWEVDGKGARGSIQRRKTEYHVDLPLTSVRTFVIDETIKLRGTVTHGVTGEPIPKFTVRLLEEANRDKNNDIELRRAAGQDGAYVIEVPRGYDNHMLYLLVEAEGFLRTRVGPNNLRNIPNPLYVNLWPYKPIQGLVRGPDGRPVNGAFVHRVSPAGPMIGHSLNLNLSSSSPGEHYGLLRANYDRLFPFLPDYTWTRTRSDGKFVIGDQPIEHGKRPAWAIGPLRVGPKALSLPLRKAINSQEAVEPKGTMLVVAPQGFAFVSENELGDARAIDLGPLAEMTVKLSERGEPLAFRRLSLRLEKLEGEESIGGHFTVMTDAEGVVRFQGVIPGSYFVEVGSASGTDRMDYRGQVSVGAGQSLTFEFGSDGHTVDGRLVVGSDAPLIDWPAGKLDGASSVEGEFDHMQSGLYLIGGDRSLEQKEKLTGLRRPMGPSRALWVDAEGRFSVTGVSAGRYRLRYLVTESMASEMALIPGRGPGRKQLNLFLGGMGEARGTILDRNGGAKPSPLVLHRARLMGYVDHEFVVPNTTEPRTVALGELTLRWAAHPTVGQVAPPFSGVIGEEETLFHSQSLVGQRMVLMYGSGGPLSDHTKFLLGKALIGNLDESVRPVLISAILAQSPSAVRFPRVRRPGKNPWLEVYVGDRNQSVAAENFGVLCVPMFFVIGPDGVMELSTDKADEVCDWLVRSGENPLNP